MDVFYRYLANKLPKKLVSFCFYRVCDYYAFSDKYNKTNSATLYTGVRASTVIKKWTKGFLDK